MSDFPNGRPPGQNNLDAGVEPYVKPENDPSAGAQKPDEDRPDTDGIEARDPVDPDVQAELDDAAKNFVDPSSAPPPKPVAKPADAPKK